jgi:hypothetical protein
MAMAWNRGPANRAGVLRIPSGLVLRRGERMTVMDGMWCCMAVPERRVILLHLCSY